MLQLTAVLRLSFVDQDARCVFCLCLWWCICSVSVSNLTGVQGVKGIVLQVGEGERGYLLELLLTKLRYAAVSPDPSRDPQAAHEGLQILGMSATMPNVSAVAQWLGAQLFQTDFRYKNAPRLTPLLC